MIWWLVWTGLVLGTMAGAFGLGRSLWRSGRALFHELVRVGQLLERLDRTPVDATSRWVHPLVATEEDLSGWREGITRRRSTRSARREQWHHGAYTRWPQWWG